MATNDRFSMPVTTPKPRNAREARKAREYDEAIRRWAVYGDTSGLEELGVFSTEEEGFEQKRQH